MAIAEWAVVGSVVLGDEVIDGLLTMGDFQGAAHDFEEFSERFFGGIRDLDLVRDTSEERIVDEVFRFQVGAKDHQLIEGDLDLFTAANRKIVVAFFEGNNPPVEEFIDAHSLAAEVVDQQYSAVAFELQWGFGDVRLRVARNFEHRHGQFTAGDDGGAFDANPTSVDGAVLQRTIII